MRVVVFLGILWVAALYAACGGGDAGAPVATPTRTAPVSTEEPAGVPASPTPAPVTEMDARGKLTTILRAANESLYTLGCIYSYDVTEGGWNAQQVIEGLPVGDRSNAAWSEGQVAALDSAFYLVTVIDRNSEATGASVFRRIDGDRRFCLVPQLPE